MRDILADELAVLTRRLGRLNLDILETGTIRCAIPAAGDSDGWSTLTFAQHVHEYGGSVHSIDLDTSVAPEVLAEHGMDGIVTLHQDDSRTVLKYFANAGKKFDVVLLDSGDDPGLIMSEWVIARELVSSPGLLIVDDGRYYPDSHGTKADHVIPYLKDNGIEFRVRRRKMLHTHADMIVLDV